MASVLDKIAFYRNRRDEVPNQELARDLATSGDRAGIQVIADNLSNKNKSVRSDCLKVLYELGYINPDLIADHVGRLLALLNSKDNRMVWGVRTLARVAAAEAEYRRKLFPVLLRQLQTCIPRDLPTHAESILPAVDAGNKQELLALLQARQGELSASQASRLRNVTKSLVP